MTYEQRQYFIVRLAVIGAGLLTIGLLSFWSARAWPTVQALVRHQAPTCGCRVLAAIASNNSNLLGLGLLAATVFVWARFITALARQRQKSRRVKQTLQRRVHRRLWHHGLGRPYILVDSATPSALTLGWFRPTVYLTTAIVRKLSGSEVAAVLRHEYAHCRQRDPLVVAIMESIRATFAMMPWFRTWVAASYSLRELVADAAATRNYRLTDGLSGAIVKLAAVPETTALAAFSPNRDRVEKLLDHSWQPRLQLWRWPQAVGLAVVLTTIVILGRASGTAAERDRLMPTTCEETRIMCQTLWIDPPPFSSWMYTPEPVLRYGYSPLVR